MTARWLWRELGYLASVAAVLALCVIGVVIGP